MPLPLGYSCIRKEASCGLAPHCVGVDSRSSTLRMPCAAKEREKTSAAAGGIGKGKPSCHSRKENPHDYTLCITQIFWNSTYILSNFYFSLEKTTRCCACTTPPFFCYPPMGMKKDGTLQYRQSNDIEY